MGNPAKIVTQKLTGEYGGRAGELCNRGGCQGILESVNEISKMKLSQKWYWCPKCKYSNFFGDLYMENKGSIYGK